jgi:hypothetical protein
VKNGVFVLVCVYNNQRRRWGGDLFFVDTDGKKSRIVSIPDRFITYPRLNFSNGRVIIIVDNKVYEYKGK